MKRMIRKIWIPILAVALVLVVAVCAVTAKPHKFNYDDLPIEEQRDIDAKIRELTKDPLFYQQESGKSCPIFDQRTANLSMRFIPNFSGLLVGSNYVVYGTIQNIQYVRLDIDTVKNEKTYLVTDSAEALSGVDYLRYTVQIKKTLLGSFGWQKTVTVDIDGDGTNGPTAELKRGQAVVLYLVGDNERCTTRYYEHGVFSVSDTGQVYAFSNMADNSVYDGWDVSVLLEDIKKMKKQLGIK